MSRIALRRLALDEVWWLVAPQNPLKAARGMAPLESRLAEARTMARDRRIRVSDIEARLGTQFTVDTVQALRRRFPRARFVWLIGADNLAQLPRWRRWTTLFRLVPIAVFAREPYSLRALSGLAARRFARWRLAQRASRSLAGHKPPAWVFLHIRIHRASATAIRESRVRAGRPGRGAQAKRT